MTFLLQRVFVCSLLALVFTQSGIAWQTGSGAKKQGKPADDEKTDEDEFAYTLENIFAEKSFFGPSARSTSISADGKFAAWLYHPWIERRHGNDLFIYDFQKKEVQRITSVSVMSEFQQATREVRDDRIKKLKDAAKKNGEDKSGDESGKAGSGKSGSGKSSSSKKNDKNGEEDSGDDVDQSGDTVTEEDADDEKGPRYGGISSFSWHPTENRILFLSGGDIYETAVGKPEITRLTKTDVSENRVEYLPDGSGIVFGSGDSVFRLVFGEHFVEQLDPGLPSGQTLSGSALSPDGKKMAIVARTSTPNRTGARTVDIIRYRDRFAQSDSVPRTVSDDEVPPVDTFVYLYNLEKSRTEESRLVEIWHDKVDEPRDTISTPQWSLASDRVTFCFFDQKTAEVQILIGEFPEDEAKLAKEADARKKPEDAETADEEEDGGDQRRFGRGERGRRSTQTPVLKNPARVVYRFSHFGGPNTPVLVAPQFAADSNHVLFVSEISGFRHLHLVDTVYESVRQLTSGNHEVSPIGISEDHTRVFVTSNQEHPSRDMVYELELESGELKQIGDETGDYSGTAVSDDGQRMVTSIARYGQLAELYVFDGRAKATALTDSHPEKARRFITDKPEMFEYENRHGHKIYGMAFKPEGWKKNKKYPLLIYVYGGPLGSSHSVNDGSYSSDGYFFNSYMSRTHDYVTVVIDPRGQSGYGGMFEKANYEQVGKPQVEDLVDGVKFLTEEYAADPEKVGVYGWSFGGFQTQMCLYSEPDVFQVGIAGAGPTEWENYNSWYTTGTVGPSRPGQPDQKKYSLRPLAKNLKGKLLLIHGMEDTNVLFQDSVAIYRELLQAGKETNVELFLDPTGGHGLGGDVKRLNRYRKYEEFLLRTLGGNEVKKPEEKKSAGQNGKKTKS